MKKIVQKISLFTAAVMVSATAFAAGPAIDLPKQEWAFNNIAHSWDKAQLMRGYQVATQVCLACHSFKYIKHRHLMDVGFTEDEVKALAAKLEIGTNDPIMSALSPEDASSLYGKEMPDLSIMNRARVGGADYVYSILTGYEDAPEGFELPSTAYYNKYFPGHAIAMPAPLNEAGQVQFFDNNDASIEDMAKDVTYFMAWASEPEKTQRQQMGVFVILYLIIFSLLLFKTKKVIWRDIKK